MVPRWRLLGWLFWWVDSKCKEAIEQRDRDIEKIQEALKKWKKEASNE